MKRNYFASLFLCLTTTFLLSQSNSVPLIKPRTGVVAPISVAQSDPTAQTRILDNYGKLPLSFEANHGQTDPSVKFLSCTGGYKLFLTGDEAVLALSGKKTDTKAKTNGRVHLHSVAATQPGGVLRMKLRNANPAAKIAGVDELPGTSNYFVGNEPVKWRTNVPTYAKVKYEEIYSGIDLVYYGNQRQLEYDFIVAPGADPHRISFDVRGAKRIRQDGNGELVFEVGDDEIRWHKPVVYQKKNGERQEIAAGYVTTDTNRVGFELAKYDASRPLYIDPLIYSTFLGGSGADYGNSIAVDSAGNAYVTGYTESADFPVTSGAFQTVLSGVDNVFITKLNPAGSALVYSTYLGGSGDDIAYGIATDSAGNAYVTGLTYSTDFPITPGAFQTTCGNPSSCGNAFVTKLNPTGSALVYSTYLGGTVAQGFSIAVDGGGNTYVTGYATNNFPVTPDAFQTTCCGAFVTKFNPTGSALVYSTYLGGSGGDSGQGIAVDSAGNSYVTGYTTSANFPVTPGAFQTTCGNPSSCGNTFVTKLNPTGSALVYSTYLGGSGVLAYESANSGFGIAVDSAGNAYVTGRTYSTNFPTTQGAFQETCGGNNYQCTHLGDAFVTKFNPTGSALVYSTYLGGKYQDAGQGIAVDTAGNAYVTGYTTSANFPVTPGAFQRVCNSGAPSSCSLYGDAFVTKINPGGSGLVCSTYLGGSYIDEGNGIVVDGASNAYVTGYTTSINFPVTPGAFQTVCKSGSNCPYSSDVFVTKVPMLPATTTTLTSSPNPSTKEESVIFTAIVASAVGPPPNGETVSFMKGKTVLGTGMLSDGSASFTTSSLPGGTNSIIAVYAGDANFAASTAKAVKQVVDKASTTTTLASSLNPSNVGQSVTFTANVVPQYGGIPTGTVTFYDGTTLLKTVGVNEGEAKYTTKTLTVGTHTITATYGSSTSFEGSTSAPLTQTVNIAPTLSSIAVAPVNSVLGVGASEQFTAYGTYSDGSSQNITSSVTWRSSNTLVATIAPGGLATAVATGSTTITAVSGPVSGTAALTIN